MGRQSRYPLTRVVRTRISGASYTDIRTVEKYIMGERVNDMCAARITAAMKTLGIPDPNEPRVFNCGQAAEPGGAK